MGGLDAITMGALAIGLMTALGFLLVAQSLEAGGGRRFQRRLARVKGVTTGSSADAKVVRRSISRSEGKNTAIDSAIKQWLPRRAALEERLAKTGRPITVGR